MTKKIMIVNEYYPSGQGELKDHCRWLKNKNIVALHLIEKYLGVQMDSNESLSEIKNIILDVSGEINRLPYNIVLVDDIDERL